MNLRLTEAELDFNRAFDGTPDQVVTDDAYTTQFPPLDIPQATEPMHYGRTFAQPAPVRSVEQQHPWLWLVYAAVVVISCIASTIPEWIAEGAGAW